ncbi:Uncharacterized protein Adt_27537 [Abeliophyllum distichum]|uniref:Reverse transcriptase domain-containing protein n=1 Tax=Abeliophyllum distichum TaxID=126358 RepID=A0ABD1RV65_9LAMI
MDIDHELTAILELFFRFTGDSLVLRGKIAFEVDFGDPLCFLKKFMEFLVVDTRSVEIPALKDLQSVSFIHHLAMKFPTPGGVAKIREPIDVDPELADEEMMLDEDLDPRIISPDSSASLVEELEAFHMNPSDPSLMLQVGQKPEEGMKEELK